jgi:ribosomal protein S18 acetylase RimI-like enzyme
MVVVRPYDEADEAAVVALWREVFPDSPPWNDPARDIERKLSVQPELFFIARQGGELAGTAMCGYDGHRGWVYYVAVSPRHRRLGVGSQLMSRVEDELRRLGCAKLNLQVRFGNDDAVAFYRSLGYDVEDRVSMGKRLAGDGGRRAMSAGEK